jgi:hypothetical protein
LYEIAPVWQDFNIVALPTELTSIAVTTPPTKTVYIIGEMLDLTGIVVTATYSDSSTEDVTADCTSNPANSEVLNTLGTQTITISYTKGSITKITTIDVTVNDETGIAETQLSNIKISPNPVTNTLHIELANLVHNATLTLFDISGKAVLSQAINGDSAQINMSSLSAGTYILRLVENGKTNVGVQIIKQ